MKKCSKCKLNKEFNEFGKDSRSKDGLKYQCKECVNSFSKSREKKKKTVNCDSCGIIKEVDYYSNKRRTTNFCQKCIAKQTLSGVKRPEVSNNNSKRWKGGKYISTDGYKMIKCDNEFHPSGRSKYKREHVIVVENNIGRELKTQRGHMGEQVHHIDGNKLNNDISNLLLCSDTRDHKKVDCQLHELAFELVRNKIIEFDYEERKYFINWEKIKCQQDQTRLN